MRKWLLLLVALSVALLFVVIGSALGRLALNALNSVGFDSEPDPMFAEPVEAIRRPDELSEEQGSYEPLLEDPSTQWVYEELSPVSKTAAELALESE